MTIQMMCMAERSGEQGNAGEDGGGGPATDRGGAEWRKEEAGEQK